MLLPLKKALVIHKTLIPIVIMNFNPLILFLIFKISILPQCFQMILYDNSRDHTNLSIITCKIIREYALKYSSKLILIRHAENSKNSFSHEEITQKIITESDGGITVTQWTKFIESRKLVGRFNLQHTFYHNLVIVDGLKSFR